MRVYLVTLLMLGILSGCAGPSIKPDFYSQPVVQEVGPQRSQLSAEIAIAQNELRSLNARLSEIILADDGAKLREEIELVKKRIAELEEQIAALPAVERKAAPLPTNPSYGTSSGSGPIFTGPRGGRYTISPSGRKQYIRRK